MVLRSGATSTHLPLGDVEGRVPRKFGLVGRTVALDTVLRDIDTRVWGESHLFITLEIPTWEMRIPSMVKYCSLAPTKCKDDPRASSDSKLEWVCMATGLLKL